MLNIHPETQFSDADYEHAVELDWLELSDNPRELTEQEAEYVFTLMTAADIKNKLGKWPTYGDVCEVIQKQREQQNKINDAKEAAFYAKHGKPK